MKDAAHRVAILLEDIQTNGLPTLDQIEAAILGDDKEVRTLDRVYSAFEIDRICEGGEPALKVVEKIFRVSEMYRLDLIRTMRFARQQIEEANQAVALLSSQQQELVLQVESLEKLVHAWEANAEAKTSPTA